MHAECIAGSQVGDPAGHAAPPPPAEPDCCVRCANRTDAYRAGASGGSCAKEAAEFCGEVGRDRGAPVDVYDGTCPVAP